MEVDMRIPVVKNWRESWKWVSVLGPTVLGVLALVWPVFEPMGLLDALTTNDKRYIVFGVAALLVIGRLWDQSGGKE
jgi:nicotinamide riboside transporter PnuC